MRSVPRLIQFTMIHFQKTMAYSVADNLAKIFRGSIDHIASISHSDSKTHGHYHNFIKSNHMIRIISVFATYCFCFAFMMIIIDYLSGYHFEIVFSLCSKGIREKSPDAIGVLVNDLGSIVHAIWGSWLVRFVKERLVIVTIFAQYRRCWHCLHYWLFVCSLNP